MSEARDALVAVRAEVARVIVGQEGVVSGLITALLAGGHVLLEGVPGVAKTLTVKALSASLSLETRRVQFTPDLMPSDVTGQLVLSSDGQALRFRPGPVFTNLLLADEINRTPPRTQAALLEAMEEGQVSAEGMAHPLPRPFVVVATQNPVEYEGTYPLPEAQLDRFLFKLVVGLSGRRPGGRGPGPPRRGTGSPRPVAALGGGGRRRHRGGPARGRRGARRGPGPRVHRRAGAGHPRAALGVAGRLAAGRRHAAARVQGVGVAVGRDFVTPDEVKAIAKPTLRHRIGLRPEVELEGATADGVLDRVLASVPVPR